ncbi:hypothetical protein ACMYR3_00240 [Ampullimonas aquatilis]|uniref:HVO_A0114 family putative DNA-binding protein n=1 Tax=Ampullimonas aquatilis TaxID=1341549 RepID=UPI003C791462
MKKPATKVIDFHVDTLKDMGERFTLAWHRAEQGDMTVSRNVSFLGLDALVSTLSEKRLALLRHLKQHPVGNIMELARALGRDYKNVHGDVTVLEELGLIEKSAKGLYAPYDELQTHVSLK